VGRLVLARVAAIFTTEEADARPETAAVRRCEEGFERRLHHRPTRAVVLFTGVGGARRVLHRRGALHGAGDIDHEEQRDLLLGALPLGNGARVAAVQATGARARATADADTFAAGAGTTADAQRRGASLAHADATAATAFRGAEPAALLFVGCVGTA